MVSRSNTSLADSSRNRHTHDVGGYYLKVSILSTDYYQPPSDAHTIHAMPSDLSAVDKVNNLTTTARDAKSHVD